MPKQRTSWSVSAQQGANVKAFNQTVRYVQGFRTPIPNGTSNVPINLNSSGKSLLGISVTPIATADISDCQFTFVVNNNNLLINVAGPNLNPNFVQGMIFFPVPQPLYGNDNINFSITKNDAGTVNVILNIFYIPRI